MPLALRLASRTAGEYAIGSGLGRGSFIFSFVEARAFTGAFLRHRSGWTATRQASTSWPRGMWEDSALTNHATAVRTRSPKVVPSTSTPIRVSGNTIARMTAVFKLLADASRLKIVLALAQDSELHVSALCEMLNQSQPAVSHHLTLMRMVGLVGFRRDGKHNYYHLASAHVRDLLEQFFADSGNGHKAIQFDDFALTFKRR
jgi:ArsR family transcriptional regulator, arsenate/arsenite/antimonite-responsive transcriptional repressor